MKQRRSLLDSFNSAIDGFVYTLKTQKNMRIHFLIAATVFIISLFLKLTRVEFIILCCTVTLVLVAEMLNTAIELLIDMITKTYHPAARVVKNIVAGVVFICSVNAVLVGYLLLVYSLQSPAKSVIDKAKGSTYHIVFIVLIGVLMATLITKIFTKRGTVLHGGMPSGHSALAFAIAATTTLLTSQNKPIIAALAFLLAAMIARSRVKRHIHTWWEVIMGAIFGTTVTLLIFQMLSVRI
ncbi:diacylglycerol kinase [bacterium]|nr:diacylglycerol kinase [bacterium]